jgi:hypothetical protein
VKYHKARLANGNRKCNGAAAALLY